MAEKKDKAQDETRHEDQASTPESGDKRAATGRSERRAVSTDAIDRAVADAGGGEDDAGADGSAARPEKRGRVRGGRHVPAGVAHIKTTFNNTLVSITDPRGGVVAWSAAGRAGFKGSRKSTAFAATLVGQDAARQAIARGMHEIEVRVQGAGAGRESAIRALQSSGLNITVIKDVTPIPHNGCRPRKRRRV
jgi:small subunit ribosomal protein S11